jgi:hypothetical protein
MCIGTFGRPRGFLAFTAQRMRVLRIIIPATAGLWFLLEPVQDAGTLFTSEQQTRASDAATTAATRYHDESTEPGLPTTGPTDPNGPDG